MLIRTILGALARGEEIGAPSMNFRQKTLGWQRSSSFVTRPLAMRALWAWPDAWAVPTGWTEN